MRIVGKKYFIELLDDCPSEFKGIIVFGLTPEGQIAAEPIPVEDLTPYTEPDLEQVRKEAYEQGYYIGYSKYLNKSYEDGLKDAWETARTLWNTPNRKEIFGHTTFNTVLTTLTAQETIEKIRQYEQGKDRQARIEFNCEEIKDVLNTTVKECNVSLDEIAAVLEKMRENK